jgi:hypothetical protein
MRWIAQVVYDIAHSFLSDVADRFYDSSQG